MKLLGREVTANDVLSKIQERLRARGMSDDVPSTQVEDRVEPRVDPLTFNLRMLELHTDATQGLPLHTHRGGLGQWVVVAKWTFRRTCQVFINEALARQRLFNGHVRDSYAQLSAEVLKLREEIEQLKGAQGPGAKGPARSRRKAPSSS